MAVATHRLAAMAESVRVVRCVEFVELATLFADTGASAQESLAWVEHMVLCEGCRAYQSQLRVTIDLLAARPAAELAPKVRGRILDAFERDWHGG